MQENVQDSKDAPINGNENDTKDESHASKNLERNVSFGDMDESITSPTSPNEAPHMFVETQFNKPTFCQLCSGFIWGISKQGYQCTACKYTVHKKCLPDVPNKGCAMTEQQVNRKAFASEVTGDRSFGVFGPQNSAEAVEMTRQIEAKIIKDIKDKHSAKAGPKIFDLADAIPMAADAASVIVEDEFTRCFESAAPRPWNWNIYLFPVWLVGVFIRYCLLLPFRVACIFFGSCVLIPAMFLSYLLKDNEQRRILQQRIIQLYCSIFIASWSGVIRYHGPRPQRRVNTVFVANHTTVLDVVILMQHNCFAVVGQKHPGVMGFFQDKILSCLGCLWFDRKDSADRAKVAEKIKKHVCDPKNLPLLLFPEGVCVNNEYCVMFKKGAFELGATVYPIAIKYNKLFSDPFYNSRTQTFVTHLLRLMKSWAVVCDVYYMEPQAIQPGESTVDFTDRIKKMICKKAGIIDVPWDGYLKYFKPSEKFVQERRKLYADSLIKRYSNLNLVELEQEALANGNGKLSSKLSQRRTPPQKLVLTSPE